jgi:hypothetical protein
MDDGATPADRGRAAVAAAEAAAFGGTAAEQATDRAALSARLGAVVAGPWWQACGPAVSVVTPRRSTRSSTARAAFAVSGDATEPVEIRLADGQLTEATVAHELAHALAGVGHGHDERFRAAHVDVAGVMFGATAAAALYAAYRAFELAVGIRQWPAPWRADGETFRIVV